MVGAELNAKGGGGGAQTVHQATYDPSTAADVLKGRFVDRSSALGVDLLSGAVTQTSPASLTVGNGGFPYELSANLIWRGGNYRARFLGPVSHVEPPAPWTTNWNNSLTISSSVLEVLGEGDIRVAAGTVAAFLAMQDTYKKTVGLKREVVSVLIGSWWLQQLSGNVVTANVGAGTRQFVREVNGNWLATGPGPYATLTQTGQRVPFGEGACMSAPDPTYPLSRGWDTTGMSFAVRNGGGDIQYFSRWSTVYNDGSDYCAVQRGFRLSSWVFPYGVAVNLVYEKPPGGLDLLDELVEVYNTLGRRIRFVESGLKGFNNALTAGDLRQVTVVPPLTLGGTYTHTATDGAITKFTSTLSGERHLLNTIHAADSATEPALQYVYDPLLRVKEARDAVALRQGTRGPYLFRYADRARGVRIDPANGRFTVDYDRDKHPVAFTDELLRVDPGDVRMAETGSPGTSIRNSTKSGSPTTIATT